jgi:toxin YoeB
MIKQWHDEAGEAYLYWQAQDKKTLKRINRLLQDIERNGYNFRFSQLTKAHKFAKI